MLKMVNKKDIELIINFYQSIKLFDEDNIRQIYESLEDKILIFVSIERDKITSLLSVSLINNNYHMEKVLYENYDEDLIKDLISYTITQLRQDKDRGLNIIYDNFPYDDVMHEIMLEQGFKCNNINLSYQNINDKQELISSSISLNDKSDDVKIYIYKRLIEEIKSNDLYLGTNSLIPDISTIRLENINVATIRDSSKEVCGTIRFSLVSDFILLDSLYASNEENYRALINLVKNLTLRRLEISISPSRVNLIKLLETMGFQKLQADYFFKLNYLRS